VSIVEVGSSLRGLRPSTARYCWQDTTLAHQTDGIGNRLARRARPLDLFHFLEGFDERGLGILKLDLELVGRALEVLV
jgi:hypothetical protein